MRRFWASDDSLLKKGQLLMLSNMMDSLLAIAISRRGWSPLIAPGIIRLLGEIGCRQRWKVKQNKCSEQRIFSDPEEDETAALGPTVSTYIMMKIDARSKRDLKTVLDEYATADVGDFGFTKTRVPVELARLGDENFVSRSQAKRLLARLDRFRDVILDFHHIDSIGQAFADEIFRVYKIQHPEVNILPINANEDVMRMIFRAMRSDADV